MLSRIVLIYAMPEEKRDAAAETLKAAGLPVLFVGSEKYALSLKAVLEMSPETAAGDGIDETFAVLHGFSRDGLDPALEALRSLGIGLKAVSTPTNLSWSGEKLYKNLKAEREAIKRAKNRKKR
ncbi:MAG: DUF3783 domain-containing protein [Oscillospiraceae bacterium]|nr:DUF3783 domain-containing protein [Oscillospiraceae bacterium]